MDFGTLANLIVTLALSGVGGVIWLIRLEGKLNVEAEKRQALSDRMLGQETRMNGFEERIYAKLDRIEAMLREKADKE
jgi:hypothetical protein